MTSFERARGDQNDRRPPPELTFWACLAIVTAMGVVGLLLGIATSEIYVGLTPAESWAETALAILILSVPVLTPAAVLYMSVFCRYRQAALATSVCFCIVSVGAFFGMLAATFYSAAATAVLLLIFGMVLRVGHLNSCWYKVLEQDNVPPRTQFLLPDLGLAIVSLAVLMSVAAWTWTWAR